MEIDKKIIIKLVQALDELKKSIKDVGIENNEKKHAWYHCYSKYV